MGKFPHQLDKVVIHNLDNHDQFSALYNPKEISIDQSVSWTAAKDRSQKGKFEFTHAQPKSFSCELFCDLYEARGDARVEFAEPLFDLAEARKYASGEGERPCVCLFVWGRGVRFLGVIESVSIKYTMFLATGIPCRATATIKLKEAKYMARTQVERDAKGRIVGYAHVERGDRSGGTGRTSYRRTI